MIFRPQVGPAERIMIVAHVLPVSLAAWFTRTFCGLLGLLPKVQLLEAWVKTG